MTQPPPPSIEPELTQPTPRRIAADVPDFREGRTTFLMGALYVFAWLGVLPMALWLLLRPEHATGANTTRDRLDELKRLKRDGVKVEAEAWVESVQERTHEEYGAKYIERVVGYRYPGGQGTYTDGAVSPHALRADADADRETAETIGAMRRGTLNVQVVYLAESPAIHCLAPELDRELQSYGKEVAELNEKDSSNHNYLLMALVTAPGWMLGLSGLAKMAATYRDQFFIDPHARRHRDLARDGTVAAAVVTKVLVTRKVPFAGEHQEVQYQFDVEDGPPRQGKLDIYVVLESDRIPLQSHITVLYDPQKPDNFLRYRELRGVRVLPAADRV